MQYNKTGMWGEVYTARYLRDNGYEIIAANYRCRLGEIDVIAKKGGVICFIEVKTRGQNPMFRPMEAVDYPKQSRIKATAEFYIKESGAETKSRFDVAEVTLDSDNKITEFNYIENAF